MQVTVNGLPTMQRPLMWFVGGWGWRGYPVILPQSFRITCLTVGERVVGLLIPSAPNVVG